MSLKPIPIPPVPGVTVCVACAAFPHRNIVMQLRDELGTIYTDEVFADLFPTHGQPGLSPVAAGKGSDLPISGRLDGSSSRRCGA